MLIAPTNTTWDMFNVIHSIYWIGGTP